MFLFFSFLFYGETQSYHCPFLSWCTAANELCVCAEAKKKKKRKLGFGISIATSFSIAVCCLYTARDNCLWCGALVRGEYADYHKVGESCLP